MGTAIGAGIVTATIFISIGFVFFGIAMRAGTSLGRGYVLISIVFGVGIPIGAALRCLAPFRVATSLPPLLFVFFLPLGRRLYSVANPSQG